MLPRLRDHPSPKNATSARRRHAHGASRPLGGTTGDQPRCRRPASIAPTQLLQPDTAYPATPHRTDPHELAALHAPTQTLAIRSRPASPGPSAVHRFLTGDAPDQPRATRTGIAENPPD